MWWSPDSRKVAYYRFDEKQVPDYYLQLDQTKIQSTNDVEAYPKAGAANPIVDLFVYDVRHEEEHEDRRARRQAVRQRRRRPLRLPRVLVARRPRAAVQPHEPPPEHPRVRGRQPRHGCDARHRPRRVADRLGRQPAADAVPEGQPALHLGVGAQRLRQPLSVRSRRQADHAADDPHVVRGHRARQGR